MQRSLASVTQDHQQEGNKMGNVGSLTPTYDCFVNERRHTLQTAYIELQEISSWAAFNQHVFDRWRILGLWHIQMQMSMKIQKPKRPCIRIRNHLAL